jgi:hypothetical protein
MMKRLRLIFDEITFEVLWRVFLNWIEKLTWVIEHDSAYFREYRGVKMLLRQSQGWVIKNLNLFYNTSAL